LAPDGALMVDTTVGVLRDAPPQAWQVRDGQRVQVDSRFVLWPRGDVGPQYGFEVADLDPEHELIIDPAGGYSTVVGGNGEDSCAGIAVDAAGTAYLVGTTQSLDFPATLGAFDRALAGPSNPPDVFVAKLNATGSALVYATYLGGGSFESGRAIAIDAAGN